MAAFSALLIVREEIMEKNEGFLMKNVCFLWFFMKI